MNTIGWLKGLRVTADGSGIVSYAGVALLRALADNIGLTAGLSKVLVGLGNTIRTGTCFSVTAWVRRRRSTRG